MLKMQTKLLVVLALTGLLLLGWAFDYDLNGDGWVNQADYDLLAGRVVDQDAAYGARYDVNGDGRVDAVDVNLLRTSSSWTGGYKYRCRTALLSHSRKPHKATS